MTDNAPTEVYAPIISDDYTIKDALTQILKISHGHNTLRCGARQCSKSVIRGRSKLLVLAADTDEKYKHVMVGLARKMNVPVILVDSHEELGMMACIGRVTHSEIRKVPRCAAVSVDDYVVQSVGRTYIEEMIAKGTIK